MSQQEGQVDPLLRLFAGQAERKGLELEITLQMGGLLVSGLLTSAARYSEELDAQISDGLAIIDPAFKPDDLPAADQPTDLSAARGSEFIHVRDACISSLRVGPVIHAPVWRGRLASVDGFVLGVPEHLKADYVEQMAYGH